MQLISRAVAVCLLVGWLAACSSSKPHTSAPSTSSSPTQPAQTPRFDVVLDDTGLRFPPGPTPAGPYVVSFADRRSARNPAEHLHLQFLVPGPQILLIDVPAGSATNHLLLQNMSANVVDAKREPVVGEFQGRPDRQADRTIRNFPVTNPLDIVATPKYSTPVT